MKWYNGENNEHDCDRSANARAEAVAKSSYGKVESAHSYLEHILFNANPCKSQLGATECIPPCVIHREEELASARDNHFLTEPIIPPLHVVSSIVSSDRAQLRRQSRH